VEDNLKFVLPKDRRGGISSALERVGLGEKKKRYPFELSGGEKQRVAIARALACPHDLLLMDEPFSALDLSLKKSLIELIVSLWQESGETVVFVTHDVHEAALLSSRALVLREGKIAADVAIDRAYPRDFLAHCPEEETLTRALLKQADFAS
ncbi:MAG: ATP-binding cassette domain-containing protein, partial [Clostridiales bacterium]|nr:ATP-binding cassette domain-containing protein [Clostridiales bacterium]